MSDSKRCSKCKQAKPNTEFKRDKKRKDGFGSHCLMCARQSQRRWRENFRGPKNKWRRENPEKARLHAAMSRYQITAEQVLEIWYAEQCSICGTSQSGQKSGKFYIDHCHKSGLVRGALCSRCNAGIGHFEDDIKILDFAIAYLEKHGNNNQHPASLLP